MSGSVFDRSQPGGREPRFDFFFVSRVSWRASKCRWTAGINHDGTRHNLGTTFKVEVEAARAYMYDDAARQLWPKGQAHGGRAGAQRWKLNFPTAVEEAYATQEEIAKPKKKQSKRPPGPRSKAKQPPSLPPPKRRAVQ